MWDFYIIYILLFHSPFNFHILCRFRYKTSHHGRKWHRLCKPRISSAALQRDWLKKMTSFSGTPVFLLCNHWRLINYYSYVYYAPHFNKTFYILQTVGDNWKIGKFVKEEFTYFNTALLHGITYLLLLGDTRLVKKNQSKLCFEVYNRWTLELEMVRNYNALITWIAFKHSILFWIMLICLCCTFTHYRTSRFLLQQLMRMSCFAYKI